MKVYKFGGASVKDVAGIQNLAHIVGLANNDLVVVVSAMGKTTNGLEAVVNALWSHDIQAANQALKTIQTYHQSMIDALQLDLSAEVLFPDSILQFAAPGLSYDAFYDSIVSLGELASTRIVSAYLAQCNITNQWLDMTQLLRTDNTFREAVVDWEVASKVIQGQCQKSEDRNQKPEVRIIQGFIGGTADGEPTTLGREGSDYTAALVANFLDAEDVTIWKDVPGILNADPRTHSDVVLIPELSYEEAVQLAESGAQIIHRKTIAPIQQKHIPLYVKPFLHPEQAGSIIHDTEHRITVKVEWGK